MRIPLVRSGNDQRPIAWWEWLFLPLFLPLLGIVLIVVLVASIPISAFALRRQKKEEEEFQRQLSKAGRFVDWGHVEAKASSGQGTLILQTFVPKGPIRHWWTEEDLIGKAPVSLPDVTERPRSEEDEKLESYAAGCNSTCGEGGSARLTQAPRSFLEEITLYDRHPLAKILQLKTFDTVTSVVVLSPRKIPKSKGHSYVLSSFGQSWTLEWDHQFFKLKDPAGQVRINVDAQVGHRELDAYSLWGGNGIQFVNLQRSFYFLGNDGEVAIRELRSYVLTGLRTDPEQVARLRRKARRGIGMASSVVVLAGAVLVLLGMAIFGKRGPLDQFINQNPGMSAFGLFIAFALVVLIPTMIPNYLRSIRFLDRQF